MWLWYAYTRQSIRNETLRAYLCCTIKSNLFNIIYRLLDGDSFSLFWSIFINSIPFFFQYPIPKKVSLNCLSRKFLKKRTLWLKHGVLINFLNLKGHTQHAIICKQYTIWIINEIISSLYPYQPFVIHRSPLFSLCLYLIISPFRILLIPKTKARSEVSQFLFFTFFSKSSYSMIM